MTLTDVERMELARRINSRNGRHQGGRNGLLPVLQVGSLWGWAA